MASYPPPPPPPPPPGSNDDRKLTGQPPSFPPPPPHFALPPAPPHFAPPGPPAPPPPHYASAYAPPPPHMPVAPPPHLMSMPPPPPHFASAPPAAYGAPPPPMHPPAPPAMSQQPPPMHPAGGLPPPSSRIQQHHQPHPHGPPPPPPIIHNPPPHDPLHQRPPPPPNGTAQQPRSKIDPAQIPKPPLFTRPTDLPTIPIFYPRRHLDGLDTQPPPAADSRFLTYDDGNAAPQLMRSTVYAVPRDRSLWSQTGNLPLGLLCMPLALTSEDVSPRLRVLPDGSQEEWSEVQSIPLASLPPQRCSQCLAYANPFSDNGRCNLCGTQSNLPHTLQGTTEYVVSGPYVTRPTPVEPNVVYALDATCPHLESYVRLLPSIASSLPARAKLGVVLVSSFGIYIPKVVASGDGWNINFCVMSDVTEQPYCPLPLNMWALDASSQECTILLERLWHSWQPFLLQLDTRNPYSRMGHADSCGGAALQFLADALQETGGRGVWISWRRPSFGVGELRDRERHSLQPYRQEETERLLYVPLQLQHKVEPQDEVVTKFYKDLAADCAKQRVALDVVLHTRPRPMAYMDVATLGHVCRVTCGKLVWIKTTGNWKESLKQAILRPVATFCGTDAVFKVRCSQGLQVKGYLSTSPGVTVESSIVGSPELELSVVNQDTLIAVELEHRVGGLPKKDKLCFIQSALLYTTSSGQRRVRVSNLALKIGGTAADIYRSIDFGALTSFYTQQAISHLWVPRGGDDNPMQSARRDLADRAVKTLAGYRSNTDALNLPGGQLILPDKLQLLPLFCMALLKSVMFRSSLPLQGSGMRADHPSPSADDRAYVLWYGANVGPAISMLFAYPNIFSLSTMATGDGEWQIPRLENTPQNQTAFMQAAHHAHIQLPKSVTPSIACIEEDQIYLIDDGMTIFILVGQEVNRDVKAELIEATPEGCTLSTSSDFGQRVERLAWQLRTYSAVGPGSESMLRPNYAPLIVVQAHPSHKDPFEEQVMSLMVNDAIGGEQDYVDFLVEFHKLVRKTVAKGIASGSMN